jgi:hypothetical protein
VRSLSEAFLNSCKDMIPGCNYEPVAGVILHTCIPITL